MWQTKYFKTESKARSWMEKNYHKYQMELIFINQKTEKSAGYGVEYKPLIKIY
jgi:hypothetical protein